MTGDVGDLRPDYVAWRPDPRLRTLVDTCHGYRYVLDTAATHRGLPSPAMTVVISFDEPLDVGWLEEPASRATFWSLASGLHTRPAEIFQHGREFGIQIGLTALGARSLFGMPMGMFARDLVAMEDLLPATERGWYDDIAGQPTWRRRFEVLEALLLRLAARHRESVVSHLRPELTWAWSRITATGGTEPVNALADELGWSRRHLHHQFKGEYGISPKQAARIVRFQRSKSLFSLQHHTLSDVAATCGYADQAHLTREWRSLTGYSPWQWMQAEFPFVQDAEPVGLTQSTHV